MSSKYQDFMLYLGQPCGPDRIAEIERNVGRELPADYAQFIMETGGGYLNSEHEFLLGDFLPTDPICVSVEQILGNGVVDDSMEGSLDHPTFGGPSIAETWEYPDEALLFAISNAGPHVVYMINYELPEYPVHSIVVFNSEKDSGLVAESFTEFMGMLTKAPDWDSL